MCRCYVPVVYAGTARLYKKTVVKQSGDFSLVHCVNILSLSLPTCSYSCNSTPGPVLLVFQETVWVYWVAVLGIRIHRTVLQERIVKTYLSVTYVT